MDFIGNGIINKIMNPPQVDNRGLSMGIKSISDGFQQAQAREQEQQDELDIMYAAR